MPRWLLWVLGSLAALALVGALLIGAFVALGAFAFSTTTDESVPPASAARYARVTIPAAARDVHAHSETFQDTLLHLRFEISPSDLPAVESSLMCTLGPVTSKSAPSLQPLARPWWKPQAATSYRECSGQELTDAGNIRFFQSVLVDMSDPGRYLVYVVAGDT